MSAAQLLFGFHPRSGEYAIKLDLTSATNGPRIMEEFFFRR